MSPASSLPYHHILFNPLAQYLLGILTILEQTGCPNYPFASTSNGWTTAFHNVYATVALDCHHPVGKNRHHKFKDKMVEIWVAMESKVRAGERSPESSPAFALGLRQLERYRAVTRDTEETRKMPRGGAAAKIELAAAVSDELPAPAAVAAAAQGAVVDAPPPSPGPMAKPAAEGGAAKADSNPASSTAPVVAAATAASAVTASGSAAMAPSSAASTLSPGRIPLPRRGRPRHLRNPPNAASTKGPTSRESLVRIEDRLHRLEALAFHSFLGSGSGPGSKLLHASAANLGRLHHLWLQNRATATASSSSSSAPDKDRARHAKRLQPYYEDAIRAYLSQLAELVADQDGAVSDADPEDLFAALQDLDALMRAQDLGGHAVAAPNGGKRTDVAALIRDAYRVTLDAYLKRVNPDLAEEEEEEELSDAEESSDRRPSRKRPADEAMGGAGDHDDEEDDDDDDDEEEDGDADEEDGEDHRGADALVVDV